MEEIQRDLYLIRGFPKYSINIYVIGDVLIDAGTRFAKNRILRDLRQHKINAHAITHAHPDHQGASAAVCDALNIPLWCPVGDATSMATGDLRGTMPSNMITRLQMKVWAGPAYEVYRELQDGDEIGVGFVTVNTPGHSPGHVSFWRESDRTLVIGDALFGGDPITQQVGLQEPPQMYTINPAQNRDSLRRLTMYRPKTICFGHGPPLRDGDAFLRFVDKLP